MLEQKTAYAIVAVADIARARTFYVDTLGLPVAYDMGDVMAVSTGDTVLHLYRSDVAGGNRGNAVVWGVGDDIEAIVAALADKGVVFEHYDMPGMTLDGDLHVMGDFRAAWFRDPDGNILHLNSFAKADGTAFG